MPCFVWKPSNYTQKKNQPFFTPYNQVYQENLTLPKKDLFFPYKRKSIMLHWPWQIPGERKLTCPLLTPGGSLKALFPWIFHGQRSTTQGKFIFSPCKQKNSNFHTHIFQPSRIIIFKIENTSSYIFQVYNLIPLKNIFMYFAI